MELAAPEARLALHSAIRQLMRRNVKGGYCGLLGQHYCHIAPALKAKKNLRSLFAMQEEYRERIVSGPHYEPHQAMRTS